MTGHTAQPIPSDGAGITRSEQGRAMAVVYVALALTGLVGTWYFNLRWGLALARDSREQSGIAGYLSGWFANDTASSAAVDLIVTTAAASIVYWRERWIFGQRPWALLFIPLSLITAVSFAFPLFLGLRELAQLRQPSPYGRPRRG